MVAFSSNPSGCEQPLEHDRDTVVVMARGDLVGANHMYDAPPARGGSGCPVLNSQAEVIGINEAYIDGFSGGTLGISIEALRPLSTAAKKKSLDTPALPKK